MTKLKLESIMTQKFYFYSSLCGFYIIFYEANILITNAHKTITWSAKTTQVCRNIKTHSYQIKRRFLFIF